MPGGRPEPGEGEWSEWSGVGFVRATRPRGSVGGSFPFLELGMPCSTVPVVLMKNGKGKATMLGGRPQAGLPEPFLWIVQGKPQKSKPTALFRQTQIPF